MVGSTGSALSGAVVAVRVPPSTEMVALTNTEREGVFQIPSLQPSPPRAQKWPIKSASFVAQRRSRVDARGPARWYPGSCDRHGNKKGSYYTKSHGIVWRYVLQL